MPFATARTLLGSLVLLGWCLPSPAEPARLRLRTLSRVRVDEPVLALAFVGEGRLLSLAASSVSLWRLDDGPPRRSARSTFAAPPVPVRHGGGLVVGKPDEGAAWLLSSYLEGARLARVDGPRIFLDESADAAPWPNAPSGLRFRSGTNVVEGIAAGDGALSILAVDPVSRAVVREDGMLVFEGLSAGIRVGSAIASLWPGMLIVSAAHPPAAQDTLLALRRAGDAWEQCWSLELQGSISALASRVDPRSADVVVALRSTAGTELLHLELRPVP